MSKLPFLPGIAGKTIYVGLSGGVDSAVSAAILKSSGAKVVGVYMKNWAGEDGLQLDCPWKEEMIAAQAAAAHLEIEFLSYNFEREYKASVLDYFFAEYKAGRTPNPDILCNSEIKFKAFLDKATDSGADLIATGHYARIAEQSLPPVFPETQRFLLKALDSNKDQTYFLSGLNLQQLNKAVFPLANLTKPEVRLLATQLGLPNATKPDSQGICFIGDLDVNKFLHKYIRSQPGKILDIDTGGNVGQHDGLAFYTIGQREGLKIGGAKLPYYVSYKDLANNTLYVAQGQDHPSLYQSIVTFESLHLINSTSMPAEAQLNELTLTAAIRYRQQPQSGRFVEGKFEFTQPQRAVSPGQSIVFYAGGTVLGRAIIA